MTSHSLITKHCIACEGGAKPLTAEQIQSLLSEVEKWHVADNQKSIRRGFDFKNFFETMAFVNAIAWIAHQENHHPDLQVGYNSCIVTYQTHAIDGLSENDFICAAKVDAVL